MSKADEPTRYGGYSVPSPMMERLRSLNSLLIAFWASLEGDMVTAIP